MFSPLWKFHMRCSAGMFPQDTTRAAAQSTALLLITCQWSWNAVTDFLSMHAAVVKSVLSISSSVLLMNIYSVSFLDICSQFYFGDRYWIRTQIVLSILVVLTFSEKAQKYICISHISLTLQVVPKIPTLYEYIVWWEAIWQSMYICVNIKEGIKNNLCFCHMVSAKTFILWLICSWPSDHCKYLHVLKQLGCHVMCNFL